MELLEELLEAYKTLNPPEVEMRSRGRGIDREGECHVPRESGLKRCLSVGELTFICEADRVLELESWLSRHGSLKMVLDCR